MKKILAMSLCILMLSFMFIACTDGDGTTDVETTENNDNVAVTPSEIILIADGKAEYTIVRPERAGSFILDALTMLRNTIDEKYSMRIMPQDDWVQNLGGEAYVSDAPEILIGATNRKESRDVLATLQPGQYKICVSGNKLVVIGYTDFLTSVAVETFIASVIDSADSTNLAIPADYSFLELQGDYYPSLEGITLYAMGDSYFGGLGIGKTNTWVNMMGEKYNMHYVNYGIDGSVMTNYVTSNNPMVDRYTSMEKGDADVILLEGGRNDRTVGAPIGDVSSRDSKTYMGAINIMLDGMLEKYPNALIILLTPWNDTSKVSTGLSNVDYANAMRTLVEHRNDPRIVCLYAADPKISGVNMTSGNFRSQYCINPDDVSHLNIEGMKMIQPLMEKFIATELEKFKG